MGRKSLVETTRSTLEYIGNISDYMIRNYSSSNEINDDTDSSYYSALTMLYFSGIGPNSDAQLRILQPVGQTITYSLFPNDGDITKSVLPSSIHYSFEIRTPILNPCLLLTPVTPPIHHNNVY